MTALRWLVMVVATAGLPAPVLAQPGGNDAAACEKGNGAARIGACTRLIESGTLAGSSLRNAYFGRGVGWRSGGEHGRAIADFSECIRLDATYDRCFLNRGISRSISDDKGALADFDEAVRLDAGDPHNFYRRGEFLVKVMKDHTRGIADLNVAIRLDPAFAEAFLDRGNAYRQVQNPDAALADLGAAIKLRPDYELAYFLRGMVWLEQKKDYDRAILDFNEAVRLAPADAENHQRRGLAHYYKRNFPQAIADLSESLRLGRRAIVTFAQRGLAYEYMRDYDRAIADYGEALTLDPKYVWAYVQRGSVRHTLKDYDRAIADYNEALKLEPANESALLWRGSAWHNKNDSDRAVADWSELLKVNPRSAAAYFSRSAAWMQKGDYTRALFDANEAIGINNDHSGALNRAAWLLATAPFQLRNGARAVGMATRSCELTQWNNPDYLDKLAAAYAEAGNFAEAVRWQQRALEFPEFEKRSGADAQQRLALYRQGQPYRMTRPN